MFPYFRIALLGFVIIGVAGWVILVIPELHFLYKDYLGLLGSYKLAALLLAAIGMFFAMPVWLTDRLYQHAPLQRGRDPVMAGACALSIGLGQLLM